MCATCGCSEHDPERESHHHHEHGPGEVPHVHPHRPPRTVRLEEDVLAKNDRLAERNRAWLDERGVVALNVMSAPGAGKTTLLERTVRELGREIPIGVIEGDQATRRDAERIQAAGGRVVQINTGSGCHLDADMIRAALRELDPPARSLVLIENVGNLVCPALFGLGERAKVVMMSVTEGEDKPLKYPHMFRASDVLVLTKIDLLPYLDVDKARCLEFARRINPRLEIIETSATRGEGLAAWYARLRTSVDRGVRALGGR